MNKTCTNTLKRETKIQLIIGGVSLLILVVLFSMAYYAKIISSECLISNSQVTNGVVTSLIKHGRQRQVLYEYNVDDKKYVGSTALSYNLVEGEQIKIVYCKEHPDLSLYYQAYLEMIKKEY